MSPKRLAPVMRTPPVVAVTVGPSAGTTQAQSVGSHWQGVQDSGALRCGAAVAAPYATRDPATGGYSGFFADLRRDFAKTLDVGPKFVDAGWDSIVAGLQAGKWDMALALNRTPARAMAADFSVPAMQHEISPAYNKANPTGPSSAPKTPSAMEEDHAAQRYPARPRHAV